MQTFHLIAEPESRSSRYPGQQTVLWTLILSVAVVRFWLLPLRTGFWLDETGTAWAIRGNAGDVIAHSLQWPSQMPLYSLIEWAVSQVAGVREWALRLPSLFAAAGAAWMLYRLGRRLLGRQAALLATVIFACSESVDFAAADARPYALGLAAVIGSTLLLFRWFEGGRKTDAAGYCLLASFMLHMHYTFGTALVVHAAWVLYRVRIGALPKLRSFAIMTAAVVLSLIPSWPHLRVLLAGGGIYGFAATPRLTDLLAVLTPPVLACSLLAALLLSWLLFRGFQLQAPVAERSTLVLILAWSLIPTVLIYTVSVSTGLKIFLPRYLLTCTPGLALLAAWAWTAIGPRQVYAVAASFVLIFSVFSVGWRDTAHGGDWRQATEAVNRVSDERTPVLVRSGFVESTLLDWSRDPQGTGYLFAPLSMYPVRGHIVRLPYGFNGAAKQDLEQFLSVELESVNRLILLTSGDDAYELWLSGRLATRHVTTQALGHFGDSRSSLRAFVFRINHR